MIKLGIIGFGNWGQHLVRNFYGNHNFKIEKVADCRQERLNIFHKLFPAITTASNHDEIINDPDIEAVAIATPVYTHYQLAKSALEKRKHVLLEKPMTSSSAEAMELITLAGKNGLSLMVDHVLLYTTAVQRIKQLIDNGTIGKVKYLDSTRINLGIFQPDVNVLWDLAPHDLSVLFHLISEKPYSLNATGISLTKTGIENIAFLTINFESGLIAHFNCSWVSPVKIRMMLIGGDSKMIVFNDLEPVEKVKVYDSGFSIKTDELTKQQQFDYRTGDIFCPKTKNSEALALMVEDFAQSILNNKTPVSDLNCGFSIIKTLEASSISLRNKGKEVIIK